LVAVNGASLRSAPHVVEVIGPAGAGKTTLLRALSERRRTVQPGIALSRGRKLSFLVGNTAALLPAFLRHYRHTRWFDRRETRSMVYLRAWLRALERQSSDDDLVIVFDHGPLYRLAVLREFGPELTKSEAYRRWWTGVLNEWIGRLDMLIWLDAPNEVLLKRILMRERWHFIQDKDEQEAHEILTHYRTALTEIIAEAMGDGSEKVLRFDSGQESVGEIAERVVSAFEPTQEDG
jgi:adenylate kinase family enzyme